MQILELEQKYSELKSDLSGQISKRTKLLKISEYLGVALLDLKSQLIEPYIIEFIPDFIKSILDLEIRGLNPDILHSLSEQIKKLKNLNLSHIDFAELEKAVEVLKDKIDLLNDWLNNKNISNKNSKVLFPLLERIDDHLGTGYLESVSVVIKNGEQRFNISPADFENDAQLEKQVQLCFKKAIEYCKKYIKHIKTSHTVYLHFENRLGILTGNSLGAALTLSFIEAVLKHYNSPIVLNINNCVAITGGIDDNSKIISTSKAIVQSKTSTIFFSDVKIFCVSKIDELWASEKLKELNSNYPNRELKIIGLTDLNDLLDRRQIVEVRKQKLIVRSGKFVKKNWISAVATVMLAILFTALYVMDFDDNPSYFSQDGKVLSIRNKNGKVLWDTKMNFAKNTDQDRTQISIKIIDINNDGKNEILLSDEDIPSSNSDEGRVACYDHTKRIIWKYNLRDSTSTFRAWTNSYNISIIDTLTINEKTILFLMSRNTPNFPSAVFKLDLSTGKRVDSLNTLWNAGTITNGLIGDFNEDGEAELVLAGVHNGFQRAIFFSINVNNIGGQTPAPERYVFNKIRKAKMNEFILLPHTDYGKIFIRNNAVTQHQLRYIKHSNSFEVATTEGYLNPIYFYYGFDKDLNFQWVDCGDNAQQMRDSLVAKGILQKPFTNTNEYFEILRKQIEYWDGKKFMNIDERNK